jgi:hypothetical protein
VLWSEVCGGVWFENLDFKESQLYCGIIIIKNINKLIRKQETQNLGRVKIRIHSFIIKKCAFRNSQYGAVWYDVLSRWFCYLINGFVLLLLLELMQQFPALCFIRFFLMTVKLLFLKYLPWCLGRHSNVP